MIAAAVAVPIAAITGLLVFAGAGSGAKAAADASAACGGGGTAQSIDATALSAEQMGNARTIVEATAARGLPAFAAVVAVDTAFTESALRNSAARTDHDSEGLFQQRVSIYTAAVAVDPVASTDAFLNRLVRVANWQNNPVGVDAQTVQISQFPDRYQPNAGLAQQIVGEFWAAAVAAAPPAGAAPRGAAEQPAAAIAPICAGGGGAAGSFVGPAGNNVAGTTTIPAGLTITGSPLAQVAIGYALAQIGKPYVFGAAGPNAFDCSGLVMRAWAAAGVALPHLASAQATAGRSEPTDLSAAVGGDLVAIPGSDGTAADPGHDGMVVGYVDATDGRYLYLIQAPMTGLSVELTEASEWNGQVVAVRHIA